MFHLHAHQCPYPRHHPPAHEVDQPTLWVVTLADTCRYDGTCHTISLADALGFSCEGNILLLDEISSSLDAETEKILFDRLFAAYADKTIICVTHRKEVADRCQEQIRADKEKTLQPKLSERLRKEKWEKLEDWCAGGGYTLLHFIPKLHLPPLACRGTFCGFSARTYLYRIFKLKEGCTPTEWREKMTENVAAEDKKQD